MRLLVIAAAVLTLSAGWSTVVAGDATTAPDSMPTTQRVGSAQRVGTVSGDLSGLWKTIAALAAVVALVVVIRFAARRLGMGPSGAPGERIEVLSRRGLSAKHQVVLLRIGKRELLVGVSPGGVNLLTEIEPLAETSEQSKEHA